METCAQWNVCSTHVLGFPVAYYRSMAGARGELVRAKIAKSRDFLDMADLAGETYFDPAVSLAVSAAVNASDVLCVIATGGYPAGDSHADASRILRKAGYQQAGTHLARVLAVKNKAQYSGTRCSRQDATDAIRRARRLLDQAVEQATGKGLLSE
jgi:hypothetical protein